MNRNSPNGGVLVDAVFLVIFRVCLVAAFSQPGQIDEILIKNSGSVKIILSKD
jgi:hypothetical protein